MNRLEGIVLEEDNGDRWMLVNCDTLYLEREDAEGRPYWELQTLDSKRRKGLFVRLFEEVSGR